MKVTTCFLTMLILSLAVAIAPAQRPSVSGLLQAISDLEARVDVLEVDADKSWNQQGTLADIDTTTTSFPLDQYEYGISYNSGFGQIHEVVINRWNLGIRISTKVPYWSGDNSQTMELVHAVFTRGLQDHANNTDWHHRYYMQDANGSFVAGGSNGIVNGLPVYVRRR